MADVPELVNADDEHQWRPIFHAALQRHLDVVEFLIDAGADLSAHEGSVLHYASEVPDNKEIVKLLITHGALDPHVRPTSDLSRQFLTALFLGKESRVTSFLNQHPNLAVQCDGRGDQPIHHAARNGDTNIVHVLIENGANVNSFTLGKHSVLYCAAGHGHLETVKLLLAHNVDTTARISTQEITVLEWLMQYQQDTRYRSLIELLSRHP